MSRPSPDAPVVALDIDGTLGDHHAHFIPFFEQWLGRQLPTPWANTGDVPFWRYLGVSKATYREAKLAYRQGGLKRSMPVYPYASELTRYIRSKGYQVWICTTRPYLRLDNIDPDTRHWLRERAKVQHDGVLFGEHKYRDLVKIVGADRIHMVVDDLPEMLDQANKAGVPQQRLILRDQPYNRARQGLGMNPVARDLFEVQDWFDELREAR
jgi:hypothetical protein